MKMRSLSAVLLAAALFGCGGGGDYAGSGGAAITPGGSSFTPPGTTTAGTVNAGLAGTYSLHFFKGSGEGCTTHCSFTEGQGVAVTVGADGKLTVAGKEYSSPFYRSFGGSPNAYEVIWLDADAKIEYALSDNFVPHFNEINVGDASRPTTASGIPTFIGQIR